MDEEKKEVDNIPKDNRGVIIAAIISAPIVIVSIVVGVVVVLTHQNDKDKEDKQSDVDVASAYDAWRRGDMARLAADVTSYQANNRGVLPKGPSYWKGSSSFNCGDSDYACSFLRAYLNDGNTSNDFKDPSGVYYSLYITDNLYEGEITTPKSGSHSKLIKTESGYTIGGDSPFDEHIIYLVPGAKCDETMVVAATSKRDFAVLYQLEVNNTYCFSSN